MRRHDIALALAGLLLAACAPGELAAVSSEAVVDATPILTTPTGVNRYGIHLWEDVDGDGALELVAYDGRSIYLHELGPGGLDGGSRIAMGTTNVLALAMGDLDGDGDPDLVVTFLSAPGRVYRNEGGTFTETQADLPQLSALALADADGDGDLDVSGMRQIPAGSFDGTVVLRNDGGTISVAAPLLYETAVAGVPAWGDLDGDGDLDLAIGRWTEASVDLLRNEGGTFAAWATLPSWANRGLALGDLDGDGDLDVFVGGHGSSVGATSVIGAYVQEDDGTWTRRSSVSYARVESMVIDDLDGDGDIDAVASVKNDVFSSEPRVGLIRNDGFAYLALEVIGPLPGFSSGSSIRLVDLDGDRLPEISLGGAPLRVLDNAGGVMAPVQRIRTDDASQASALGDWDGDGDLDLAVANDAGPARLYVNEGGVLALAWSSDDAPPARDVAFADVDGDGALEIVLAIDGEPLRIHRRGETGLPELAATTGDALRSSAMAWADVDADGDVDLALGTIREGLRLYVNEGGALRHAWTSAETDLTLALAWGDADGDGDLDLAVGNGGANRLYENDGGALSLAWSSVETDLTQDLAWGDWDGDGALDLACASVGFDRIYRGEAAGLALAWSSASLSTSLGLAFEDVDEDGDDDVVLMRGTGQSAIVRHRASGAPTVDGELPVGDYADVSAGDVDGDGDADLVLVGNRPSQRLSVLGGFAQRPGSRLAAGRARLRLVAPGARGEGYGASEVAGATVEIRFAVAEEDASAATYAFWWRAPGTDWQPATVGTPVREGEPGGEALYRASWDAAADGAAGPSVQIRVERIESASRGISSSRERTGIAVRSRPFRVGCVGPCCAGAELAAAGTECRPSAGPCDLAEACTGASGACPGDSFVARGAVCRESAGECDVAEICDGASAACPEDGSARDGTTCGAASTCSPQVCAAGACVAARERSCDDGDVCTADACAEPEGCTHAPIEGCCVRDSQCGAQEGGRCVMNACEYGTGGEGSGGCGCRVAGGGAGAGGGLGALALALVTLALRRRRLRAAGRLVRVSVALALAWALVGCEGEPPPAPDAGAREDAGPSCGPGLELCGSECVDLQVDPESCGRCGRSCESGEACVDGRCTITCDAPTTRCPNPLGDYCADLSSEMSDCGACAAACAPVARASAACAAGVCEQTCEAGWDDCNEDRQRRDGDGCETELATSDASCGACGVSCGLGSECREGACACRTGLTDCGSGCIDVMGDDVENCGACGNACGALQRCERGTCRGPLRVFITSSVHTADFGGVAGADRICALRAAQGELEGSFVAWISDGPTSAASRVPQSQDPYVRLDGVTIATSWADLVDGEIAAPIAVDESGRALPADGTFGPLVWTGTNEDGTAANSDCIDWTSSASGPRGAAGDLDTSAFISWSYNWNSTCSSVGHLYCFESP